MNPFTCIFHRVYPINQQFCLSLYVKKKPQLISCVINLKKNVEFGIRDFSPTHFDIHGEYFIGPTLSYNYRMYSATVNTSQIFNRYHIGKYVDRLPRENWLIVRALRPTHTRSINELLFMNHLCSRDLLPADSGIPV